MTRRSLEYRLHTGRLAVVKLPAGGAAPEWAMRGWFWTVTGAPGELSVVCPEANVPADAKAEKGWACFELVGPFDFALTGILASFVGPLADAGVPVFALSTFDTDWVLVPGARLEEAVRAIEAAGHRGV